MKITIDEQAKTITIVAPLQAPRPSSTGKTMIVATSGGNQRTDALIQGQPVKVGFTAFIGGA